jgi:hypothetical protein
MMKAEVIFKRKGGKERKGEDEKEDEKNCKKVEERN